MEEIYKILKSVRYATISTVNKSAFPWASPVWYVFDSNLNIYWWSPIDSVHSQNIDNQHEVFITIFDSTMPEGKGIGVYMKAKARELPTEDLERVIGMYNSSTEIYKLDIKNCSGNAPTRLYMATPNQLWLNDGVTKNGYWVDIRKEIPLDNLDVR